MKQTLLLILLLLPLGIAGQPRHKMSALVREAAAAARETPAVKGGRPSASPFITALVSIDAPGLDGITPRRLLTEHGCRVFASFDDIYVAAIPLSSIEPLASLAAVRRIEAGVSNDVTLDTTHLIVHSAELWDKPLTAVPPSPSPLSVVRQGLTGKGVVVGMVDVGFDLNHPTFLTSDGTECRIRRLWDQLDGTDSGEAVVGKASDGVTDTVYVGRQYTTAAALRTKARSADAHIIGHGTHTTGIAAGSGSEGNGTLSPYIGMAPDADLCLVANMVGQNKTLVKPEDLYKYTTATDILAFKYIFDYAGSVGKPCVINLSEGSKDDFYEAPLFNDVINKMLGPGRILVCSAGNEGMKGMYMQKPLGADIRGAFVRPDNGKFLINTCSARYPAVAVTFFDSGGTEKTFMYDTSVLAAYPDSVVLDTVTVRNEGDAVIVFCAYPSGYDATKVAAEFYFHTEDTSLGGSGCPVAFRLLDSGNDIEAYAYTGQFVSDSTDPTLCDYSSDHSVLFPGSVGRVVCVGATAYRTSVVNTEGKTVLTNYGTDGERARFSSMGPTLSGLTKPDISAPGQNIVSALSSYYIEAEPAGYSARLTVRFTDYGGRRYPWTADSGTSMSSPVVAGIIALWLQHCPTLTPEQVKDIFAATARRRDPASGYPNNMYGHGEIDALAGLDYIMQHITGIRDTTLPPPPSAASACYDIQGRRVDPARYRGVVISEGRKRLLK